MMKIKLIVIFACMILAACSTYSPPQNRPIAKAPTTVDDMMTQAVVDTAEPTEETVAAGPLISGAIGNAMDSNDKLKLSRALDHPPGKSTHWMNPTTGMSYKVTPVRKIKVDGNPYCREYQMSVTTNGKLEEQNGTACVGEDGNWRPV